MARFIYPAVLTPDADDGGFIVTFPDLPEALTQGDTVEECLTEAADCLAEAVAGYIHDGRALPAPSRVAPDQHAIALSGLLALKAALHNAMLEQHTSNVALGRQLGVNEKEVRRWRDPHYGTKLPALERALEALGKRVEIHVL